MGRFFVFLMITGGFFTFTDSAFAYLDPGTGSMILQSILGTFLFIGTGIGIFWTKIKGFFTHSKKHTDNE